MDCPVFALGCCCADKIFFSTRDALAILVNNVFTDTFGTKDTSMWTYNSFQAVPFDDAGENVLKNGPGTNTDWVAGFHRTADSLQDGDRLKIDFKVESRGTRLHILVESWSGNPDNRESTLGNPDYHRFALVASGNRLYAQVHDDPNFGSDMKTLINPITVNTWYVCTITLDAGAFSMTVHERANPAVSAEYSYAMPDGLDWRFWTGLKNGTAYFDNYEETGNLPVAAIRSITPNPAIQGQNVTFSGSGTDVEGNPLTLYRWESDKDGLLSSSSSFTTSALSPGFHTITFSVQNSSGELSVGATDGVEIAPFDTSFRDTFNAQDTSDTFNVVL